MRLYQFLFLLIFLKCASTETKHSSEDLKKTQLDNDSGVTKSHSVSNIIEDTAKNLTIPFNFSILSKGMIKFNSDSLTYNNEKILSESDSCGSTGFLLNPTYGIIHYYCSDAGAYGLDSTGVFEEYIQVMDDKYSITKLFKNQLFLEFQKIYYFQFKMSRYLLLRAIPRVNTHFPLYEWILFDVTNPYNQQYFTFANGTDSPAFINDFDENGALDYIDRSSTGDTVSFYSLKHGKFKREDEFYIIVVPSQKQKQNFWHGPSEFIDVKNTKWFHDLQKK